MGLIYDFGAILNQLGTVYTWITTDSFTSGGITYTKPGTTKSVIGVMTPLSSKERFEMQGLGHVIQGKQNFYVSIKQGRLKENDIIIDSQNVSWLVEPHDADYTETGAIVKYRLMRL